MINTRIAALLDEIDRDGAVCVLDLDGPGEIAFNADEGWDTGSAFKIAIGLEIACQIANGELDLHGWLQIDADKAPIGLGTVAQAIELMLSLSDNAAANALLHRAGYDRITARLRALGLHQTTMCHDVPATVTAAAKSLQPFAEAAGVTDWLDLGARLQHGDDELATRLATIRTDRHALPSGSLGPITTARELATLYAKIWTDEAGPPEACAITRAATHELRNRIASGFTTITGARFAGKGGGFPGLINNDAGVLTYPDGHRYAISILTRARYAYAGETAAEAQLGRIAATAINQLQDGRS